VVSKGQVYYDSTGKAVRMTGINMDMTERKQAEEALRESEARLRLALEAAHTGIWDWNIPVNKVTWSDNFERLFGLETGSFGRTYEAFLECVHPEDREFVAQSVKSAVQEGANHEVEFRIVWPDGSVRWMVGQGRVFYDETGKAVRMLGTTIDITERKRAEEERVQLLEREQIAHAESEAARSAAEAARKRITNILESITDAFFALDNQWRFTYLNRQAEQLLQRTRKDLLGKNLWDEFPEAVGSVLFEQYRKAISEQVSVEFEAFYPPLNRWFDVHAYPARDGLSVYFQDITGRKRAEEALRESEARFRRFVESNIIGVVFADLDGKIAMANNAFLQMVGYTPEELHSGKMRWDEMTPPEYRYLDEQALNEFRKLGVCNYFEKEYIRKDGSRVPVLVGGALLEGSQDNTVCFVLDISDRKRAQEELQRQTMRSQLFAEVTLKIRQSLEIEEILQTTVTEVQRILKADRVLIFQLWSNGFGKIVTEAVNPNWYSVLGQNITDDYFESEYLHRYSQGRIYTIADIETAEIPDCLIEFMQEFKVKAKLAVPIFLKEKLWGLLVAHQCERPRQWSSFETELMGQLAAQIGIALAQAQLLEQETRQRQELVRSNTELQQFASIASHDLQEPLRKIQAFGNRLKDKYSEALTDQGCDYLDRMQNAAQRMQTLIDDLLILSRVTTKAQPFVPVNLTQVTQEVLSDLEVCIQQSRGHVEVGELPIIDADPLQMRQLLQNLISNAMKFHRNEELPVVKIYSKLLESQEDHPTGGLTAPELCQIIVEDNGIGFDEKYLDRIFNVFQRLHTRSEYQGTGVGLAICRKIAERHEGSITAESTLGVGSKFIVTLPIKQSRGENPE
jgi:PAS domain S-box-containing protein